MGIRNAAKALLIKEDSILLNQYMNSKGRVYYDLPGGGQNQFETMEEALTREVLEETGYAVEPVRFAALVEEIYEDEELRCQAPDHVHRIHHIFEVKLLEEDRKEPLDKDLEQTDCIWVPIEEAVSLDLRPQPLGRHLQSIISGLNPMYLGSVRMPSDET